MFAVEDQAAVRTAPLLPQDTALGPVHLAVTGRELALAIWRDVVGLDLLAETEAALSLGIAGKVLIVLEPGATRPSAPRTTGLYHVAIHVPTRADLAALAVRALRRGVRIAPTDHLVSEAIYLWDLDGNGIEITFETPWRGHLGHPDEGAYAVSADGRPHSGREPIDLDGLLAELGPAPAVAPLMPEGVRIGHVHVHVNSLEEAMVFYRDGLGFGGLFIIGAFGMGDVGLGYMPHAIAFNIWSGANARPAPADAAGLRFLVVEVPDRDALEAVRARLVRLNVATTPVEGGFEARDPSSNRVRVVARA